MILKCEPCFNRFAGVRYLPPMAVPNMVLIFDSDGQVIGLQSGAPEVDFISGDCTKNDFYVRDTIDTIVNGTIVGQQVELIASISVYFCSARFMVPVLPGNLLLQRPTKRQE